MGTKEMSLRTWFQVTDNKLGHKDFCFWCYGRLIFWYNLLVLNIQIKAKYIFQSIAMLT